MDPIQIADLKARVPLANLIGETVTLKQHGQEWRGLCPFHDETTASFTVFTTPDGEQRYHCFGCGASGDHIDWLEAQFNLDFSAALEQLRQCAGEAAHITQSINGKRTQSWNAIPPPDNQPPPDELWSDQHKRRLPVVAAWAYRDVDGGLLGYACRIELNGKKEIIPVQWAEDGRWRQRALAIPRPLYGLDRLVLHPDAQVILVEGEKPADAGRRLMNVNGIEVITWPGGCNAWAKVDWTPLTGRKVVCWPDHDPVGIAAMAQIADHLTSIGASVRLIQPDPSWPPGYDLADLETDGWTGKQTLDYLLVHAVAVDALCPPEEPEPPPTYPDPIPLLPDLEAAAPYPLDALGDLLSGAVTAIVDAVQVPPAMAAQAVLATAALAAQPLGNVLRDGQLIPLSLFFLTVAESGDRKTHTDNWALRAHYEYQRTLLEDHKAEGKVYRNKRDAYEKARRVILNNKAKASPDVVAAELGKLEEPTPPPWPYLLTEEPTLEGLQKAFLHGRPSQGLFSNEGGQFFGGYATNPENLLKTIAGLSKFWDGLGFNRLRATNGESGACDGCRLGIHLMIQPIVARAVLNNIIMQRQGFLARFLIAWPESLAGRRPYQEIDLTQDHRLQRFWKRMSELLEEKPTLNKDGDLDPPSLPLDPAAKHAWIVAHDAIEVELGKGGDMQEIKSTAAKAAENLLRIAGVMAVIECADIITEALVARAYTLIRWYLGEALRLTNPTDPQLLEAQELLDWLRDPKRPANWQEFHCNKLGNSGPTLVRSKAKKRDQLLALLLEHNQLLSADRKTFKINPRLAADFADSEEKPKIDGFAIEENLRISEENLRSESTSAKNPQLSSNNPQNGTRAESGFPQNPHNPQPPHTKGKEQGEGASFEGDI